MGICLAIDHNNNRRFMIAGKKKSELTSILDELQCQDPKKRLAAVKEIKEVAGAIGANRVRTELIGFLAEFVDDEEKIILELLSQLEGFTGLLGGAEHEKALVPLLISFCKTDEKKVAYKACQLIQRIVKDNKELALEAIKKLMKTDMNISKECGVQLISALFLQLEASESALMEMYTPLFHSDNPQVKIIASKYLGGILRNLKGKEEVSKLLQGIYSDGGELEKIYALEALVEYYPVNNNFVLTKFKHLSILNSWRINIKVCELAPALSEKVSKAHFKLIFEPIFLKFMTSSEPELRSASCSTISSVSRHMTEDEHKSKLQSVLKKLAGDSVEFVKVELSKGIVPLCGIVGSDFMCECVLPIIMLFIKDANSQIALGIVQNLEYLTAKVTKEVLDEKIVKPLLLQLSTDNWRIKCEIIEVLKKFLTKQSFLNDSVIKVFISLTNDRIDAVRLKANELLIEILTKNPKEWCDQYVIPKLFDSKENCSYIKKQNLLHIIEKTVAFVSEKVLKEIYQATLATTLGDRVSNVRLKSITVLRTTTRLSNSAIQKQVDKLKEDKDHEIREIAKKLRG